MDLTLLLVITGGLVGLGWIFDKRMKVQDKQFETVIARLNELTGRDYDDLSSKFDEEL